MGFGSFFGSLFGGGGPSSEMKGIAAQQHTLANEMMADFHQLYGEQQDTFSQLKGAYSPIVALGPNQHGFSSPVLAALNTQLINSNAAGYAHAAQAARAFGAGQGGGATSGLTTGIDKQIQASIASGFAGNLSNEQLGVTLQDYATGRQNWQTALSGMTSLGQMESPNAMGAGAGNELGAAYGSAKKIQDMENANRAAIFGGITGIATSFLPGGAAFKGIKSMFGKGGGGGGGDVSGDQGDFGGET